MSKYTLRKYLFEKRVELYETVDQLKDQIMCGSFTDKDLVKLEVAEAKLNVVKDIIAICHARNKY